VARTDAIVRARARARRVRIGQIEFLGREQHRLRRRRAQVGNRGILGFPSLQGLALKLPRRQPL
jgi:hypothetical protein